jgi:hypothetical protein
MRSITVIPKFYLSNCHPTAGYCAPFEMTVILKLYDGNCQHTKANLMFMGSCNLIIFWYIIPTRCTSDSVYLIWQLLYMFRPSLSPIFSSTKQLHLQPLVTITPYCCMLLSWKSWNWWKCIAGAHQFQLFRDSSRQQYGAIVTRYCWCSCFVLLKMGDSDARNM